MHYFCGSNSKRRKTMADADEVGPAWALTAPSFHVVCWRGTKLFALQPRQKRDAPSSRSRLQTVVPILSLVVLLPPRSYFANLIKALPTTAFLAPPSRPGPNATAIRGDTRSPQNTRPHAVANGELMRTKGWQKNMSHMPVVLIESQIHPRNLLRSF